MRRTLLLDIFTGASVLCAFVVSGAVVGREFFPEHFGVSDPNAPQVPTRSLFEAGLPEQLASTGWRSGAPLGNETVTIVEFSDFQCPSCRVMAATLRQLIQEQPGKVALAYHHFPLEAKHPHAFNASVAFECAGRQGRAQAMHDVLFARQAEIGKTEWAAFASAAGVPNRPKFEACLRSEDAQARVRADLHMARALGMEALQPWLSVSECSMVFSPWTRSAQLCGH